MHKTITTLIPCGTAILTVVLLQCMVVAQSTSPPPQPTAPAMASSPVGTMDGVNLQRTNYYPGKSVQKLSEVLWKSPKYFEINYAAAMKWGVDGTSIDYAELGFSEPIIANGLLYFRLALNMNENYLFALDQSNGEAIWRFDSKDPLSVPTIAGDTAYIETTEGILYALDAKTGKEKWRYSVKGERWTVGSSPAVSDGLIYFTSRSGSLYALDIQTRQPKWVYKTKGFLSAPAFTDDTVFVSNDKGNLYAVSRASGQEQWNFKAKGYLGDPVIADGSVYFRTEQGFVYAIDMKTGQEKWKAKVGGNVEIGFPLTSITIGTHLAARNKEVFLTGADNNKNFLYAMDGSSGQQKWKFETDGPCHSPIATDDIVYLGCLGNFLAVDAQNGTKKWGIEAKVESKGKTNRVVTSSPALSNGVLYFLTDEGYVYALR